MSLYKQHIKRYRNLRVTVTFILFNTNVNNSRGHIYIFSKILTKLGQNVNLHKSMDEFEIGVLSIPVLSECVLISYKLNN